MKGPYLKPNITIKEIMNQILHKPRQREDLQFLLGDIVYKEEVKWRQKGKPKWARDGDGNTIYFHMMATGYRKRNFIDRLEVEGVSIIENEEGIESETINFFKRLYSSNEEVGWGVEGLNWYPISTVQAAWIERPFEEEEFVLLFFIVGRTSRQEPTVSPYSSFNLAGTL